MFDRTSERVRHAISLPNILFGVEEEEIEKLVEDDDEPVALQTDTRPKENVKKEKKKWYNKIPSPGNLISPLRRSFIKLKRKYDHYDCTDFNSNIEETQDPQDSEIAGGKFSNDLDMKYSTSVSMENFFNPKHEAKEPTKEKNIDILESHMTVGEHFGEARALAHRRVKVTDILSGRYRKF